MSEKDTIRFTERTYKNWRTIFFDHGDGKIYPQKISFPKINFIQYPEPHVLITDWYENPQEWYSLYTLIQPFAEQAFLCYEKGYWHASISCAINCCECILKYEYLRRVSRQEANKLIYSNNFGLGFFTAKNSKNLKLLKLKRFEKKLEYLNHIRVGLYHFNPNRIKQINRRGNTFIEKEANPLTDHLVIPITAFKAYSIMQDLINFFYNEKMRKIYIKEGLAEAKQKNKKVVEEIHKSQITDLPQLPKELIEGYMNKKQEFIEQELKKNELAKG